MSGSNENSASDSEEMRLVSNPVLKIFLEGLYDENCNLSKLRGCPYIVMRIWREVRNFWSEKITLPPIKDEDFIKSGNGIRYQHEVLDVCKESFKSETYFAPLCLGMGYDEGEKYSFPAPTDININMMPFIVGEDFEDCKLPDYLENYWDLIYSCLRPQHIRHHWHLWPSSKIPSDIGKVYYLTIQESWVEPGNSQRRPGLHVDSPGSVKINGEDTKASGLDLKGDGKSKRYRGHGWGFGCAHSVGGQNEEFEDWRLNKYVMQGGIYVASSISGSSRAWNCGIDPSAVGPLGDIEHLRFLLPGTGEVLDPGQLYWITDRTPHESLPLKERTYRQFFRLVTADVSLWYKDHSTANPLGVEPDPGITKIVVGNKFSDEGVDVIEPSPEAIERREKFLEKLRAEEEVKEM